MGLFQSFDISASGMTAERFRIDTIAENMWGFLYFPETLEVQ